MLVVAIGIVLGSTTAHILLGGPRGPGSKVHPRGQSPSLMISRLPACAREADWPSRAEGYAGAGAPHAAGAAPTTAGAAPVTAAAAQPGLLRPAGRMGCAVLLGGGAPSTSDHEWQGSAGSARGSAGVLLSRNQWHAAVPRRRQTSTGQQSDDRDGQQEGEEREHELAPPTILPEAAPGCSLHLALQLLHVGTAQPERVTGVSSLPPDAPLAEHVEQLVLEDAGETTAADGGSREERWRERLYELWQMPSSELQEMLALRGLNYELDGDDALDEWVEIDECQNCPGSRGAGRRATVGVRWASRRRCRPQPDHRLEPFPVTQRVVPSRQHAQHLVWDR